MSTTYIEWGLGYRLADGTVTVVRDGIEESTARVTAKKLRTHPRDEYTPIPEVIRRTVTLGDWEEDE